MKTFATLGALVGLAIISCSSSDDTGSSSSGTGSCSCSVSVNGESKTIACGQSSCVGGKTQNCGANAALSEGDPCITSGSSSGSSSGTSSGASSSSGSSSGCELFKCKNTGDCGSIAPCFTTSTGQGYCYEQEGNASSCSQGTTATTKTTSNGPTTICVPSSCPPPETFVQ